MGRGLGGGNAAGRSTSQQVRVAALAAVTAAVTVLGPLGMTACTGGTAPDRVRPIDGSSRAATGSEATTTTPHPQIRGVQPARPGIRR